MLRKTGVGLSGLIVVLLTVGLGVFIYARSSLPQMNGSIALTGLSKPVEITRDANAVPHIFAETAEDAYFALGFVHAQDRLWQMEFMRRLGAGRLAEVLGEPALDTDRYIRTLGLYRLAEAIYGNTSAEVRSALDSYAAGVNAWLSTRRGALPPEFILLNFEPEQWRPADTLVWNRLMALRLGRNRKNEILRARIAKELDAKGLNAGLLDQLWPDDPPGAPATLADASFQIRPVPGALWGSLDTDLTDDSGSNGWIVHGRLTRTGKPILANDPHLSFSAPILWYLARIEAPGLTLTGVTVPGVPFTILGHNGSVAWGMTNGGADVEDMFVETLDPDDPGKYLSPEGSLPFVTRREVIRVKDAESVAIIVRETRHGPVISDVSKQAAQAVDAGYVVVLATPALKSDDRTVEALFAMNRARNWSDFRAAVANFHAPQANLLFAGSDGDIGFVSAGRIPIRKAGDGRMPVMGANGRHDWTGLIPTEDYPAAHNPASGRIVNANNRIAGDDYPYLLTRDWALPYRAERIVEVLEKQTVHGLAESQDLQRDILSIAARQVLPLMLRVKPGDERARKTLRLLSAWDFEMQRGRPEPLIYTVWLRHLVSALAGDELGKTLTAEYLALIFRPAPRFVETVLSSHQDWCNEVATPSVESCDKPLALALNRALEEISAALGPDLGKWRWGELHRATFTHKVLTKVPLVRRWADLSIESDGGNHTVSRGSTAREKTAVPFSHTDGSAYRAVYDLSNLDNSGFMISTGQSGNVLSPHYGDLLRRWRDGQFIRITANHDDVQKSAIGTLLLVPADVSSLPKED
jgi:penicillin amidase